jgi:hypothetical protein
MFYYITISQGVNWQKIFALNIHGMIARYNKRLPVTEYYFFDRCIVVG